LQAQMVCLPTCFHWTRNATCGSTMNPGSARFAILLSKVQSYYWTIQASLLQQEYGISLNNSISFWLSLRKNPLAHGSRVSPFCIYLLNTFPSLIPFLCTSNMLKCSRMSPSLIQRVWNKEGLSWMIFYPSWQADKNVANVITAEGTGQVVRPYGDLALDKQHVCLSIDHWIWCHFGWIFEVK